MESIETDNNLPRVEKIVKIRLILKDTIKNIISFLTIIEKYYSDQKRYAFSFQMMAFITRIKQINNAIEDATENQIIITERCIFTDREIFAKMLYETHKIESIEYSIYLRWFDEFVKNIDIDAFVYLDISPEICFERIKNRNRNGEEIPIEYLNSLKEYHEEWIYALPEEKVLVLDGKTNIEESLKQWLRFVSNNNNSTSMLLYLYRMIFSIFFLTIFVILFIETLN